MPTATTAPRPRRQSRARPRSKAPASRRSSRSRRPSRRTSRRARNTGRRSRSGSATRLVVDLWGGPADAAGRPWAADTLVCMMSVAKGRARAVRPSARRARPARSRCAGGALLAGVCGRRQGFVFWCAILLDHSAGLAALDAALPAGAALDWRVMTEALASATPRFGARRGPGLSPGDDGLSGRRGDPPYHRRDRGPDARPGDRRALRHRLSHRRRAGAAAALRGRPSAIFRKAFSARRRRRPARCSPGRWPRPRRRCSARRRSCAPSCRRSTATARRARSRQLYGLLARPGGSPLLGARGAGARHHHAVGRGARRPWAITAAWRSASFSATRRPCRSAPAARLRPYRRRRRARLRRPRDRHRLRLRAQPHA